MGDFKIKEGSLFLDDPMIVGKILKVKGFTQSKGIQYINTVEATDQEILIALVNLDGSGPEAIEKLEEVKFVVSKGYDILVEIALPMTVIRFTWSDAAIACWEEEDRRLQTLPLEERLWAKMPENPERLAMIEKWKKEKERAKYQGRK